MGVRFRVPSAAIVKRDESLPVTIVIASVVLPISPAITELRLVKDDPFIFIGLPSSAITLVNPVVIFAGGGLA